MYACSWLASHRLFDVFYWESLNNPAVLCWWPTKIHGWKSGHNKNLRLHWMLKMEQQEVCWFLLKFHELKKPMEISPQDDTLEWFTRMIIGWYPSVKRTASLHQKNWWVGSWKIQISFWRLWGLCSGATPPKFNSEFSPEKWWLEDKNVLLGRELFRGELLNFRRVC